MVDKNYCMSSYLALRYVEDDEREFFEGVHHQRYRQHRLDRKTFVRTVEDVDGAISNVFHLVGHEKLGILLSGGMDSACLAAYMPKGSAAYTFRFMGGSYQADELRRAETYAEAYGLDLRYVDIDWCTVSESVDAVMRTKGAPVHSIEPQIYHAADLAKRDGVSLMIIGDGADYVFGGMDGLLSRDWGYDEFVDRVTYVNPMRVLKDPVSLNGLFERYRLGPNSIDYLRFYDEIITDESYSSYANAFAAAGLAYVDPYEDLKMAAPLDLHRVRNGESKYLVRQLFKMKYPGLDVPQKLPMPRPVDAYFKDWGGVIRKEFRMDIDYSRFSGNQKWLLFCLERFLNTYDGEDCK